MMLAESLLLLCWDAERGVPAAGVGSAALRRALAAAVLAELVMHRRVEGDATALWVPAPMPHFTQVASDAVRALHRVGRALSAPVAISQIEAAIPDLRERIVRSLTGRDVLHSGSQFLRRTHPVRSMRALQEAHALLDSVRRCSAPTADAVAIAAIMECTGLLDARVTADDAVELRLALVRLQDGPPGGAASDVQLLLAIGHEAALV
jgi:hypothetical protein